jgi:hypothetical protein
MYRSVRTTPLLFPKLFHLGGKLAAANRWLELAASVDWEKLDAAYSRHFSAGYGRPAADARLVCGLLVIKRAKSLSDEETVQEFMESPYLQAFCGQEYFAVEDVINHSILSERRRRLGKDFFEFLEAEVSPLLKARKMLPPRGKQEGAALNPLSAVFNWIKKIF